MKIWILSSETPHYWGGGIARYVDNFARAAGAEGNQVTVISRGEKRRRTAVSTGYELIEFRHRFDAAMELATTGEPDEHPGWPYNNMTYFAAMSHQYAEEVERLLETEPRPDLIECQDYAALGYFLLLRKRLDPEFLKGIPVLLHLHTPDCAVQRVNQYPRYKLPDYWIGRMEIASIWMADALLSPSRFLAREINNLVEGELPAVTTIPYPWPELNRSEGPSPGIEGRLLYVGRIELRKGVEPLLAACESLWRDGHDFVLEMAGGDVHTPLKGGSLTGFLKNRYAHRIATGHLVFHGSLQHEACLEYMRKATAVLVPSLWENFPNTCIEAMSLGKVVIASQSGGQAEMVGEGNQAGLLFSHNQPGSLETAILQALSLPERERMRMGEAALRRISELCSPVDVLKSRMEHYRQVIKEQPDFPSFPFSNQRLREGPHAPLATGEPLVSVVIPYYNLGKFLMECVDSVYASRYSRFEVVVVNDGSTDPHSLEVLEQLRASNRPRLRILDIANGGLANARNLGARHANGELVAFLDADDKIGPDFLHRSVSVLKQYPNVHLVYPWVRFFGDGRGVWHSWNFDLPYLLCHNQLVPIVVVRKDSFLKHGQNKPHIVYGLEDYEGWISMAEAGCGGVAIPEPLAFYRIRKDSMFRTIESDKKLYLYDLISAEHPGLYREYGLEIFNLENANGPGHGWDQPTMFLGPQDRLVDRLRRTENELAQLEEEANRLREAEAWYKKTFAEELKKLENETG